MAKVSQEAIYEQLRERICLLQYPPGAVLSENALAAEFGPARETYRHQVPGWVPHPQA